VAARARPRREAREPEILVLSSRRPAFLLILLALALALALSRGRAAWGLTG
jgi:hypothetical protein